MKIDTHQHYWRYRAEDFPWISDAMSPLRRDRMPIDVLDDARACGVDAAVAVQARCLEAETDFLLQLADQNSHVWGVVGWIDLTAPNIAHRLDQWVPNPKFKGLRHILQDESNVNEWVSLSTVNDNLNLMQHRQLTYDVLVFQHQLSQVVEFCARHDQHWLILDHVAKPALRDWLGDAQSRTQWRQDLRAVEALPHVMCKLSGVVTETDWPKQHGVTAVDEANVLACFDHALDVFGPGRVMFGSDWPVCQLCAPYSDVHSLAARWAASRLTAEQQSAFWSGNAIRCYALDANRHSHNREIE